MLDYDIALDILRKYGFTSTEHPYLFISDDNIIGLCFIVEDENYGRLERRKTFNDINAFDDFVKKLSWMKNYANEYNVKMVFDNYEIEEPHIIFLRNNRPMLIGEMFNIQAYDDRNEKKKLLGKESRMLYEIGDLILVYDEIKIRQINQMLLINSLKNDLRKMYFELQKEIDYYNGFEIEQNLTLLNDVVIDNGINELNEISIKDSYNLLKVQNPNIDVLSKLLNDVWELLKNLECNEKYYQACIAEKEIRNEMLLVKNKLNLIKKLNENSGIKVDLMKKFRKINSEFEEKKSFVYDGFIKSKLDNVNKKYSAFSILDKECLADFLRESLDNNDYEELISRFIKDDSVVSHNPVKLPYENIVADLNTQYKLLTVAEQAILILCNSSYFSDLIKIISAIPDFEIKSINELLALVSKQKEINLIKRAYSIIKIRIENPENLIIKQSVFANINFNSFESFITSIVNELKRMRLIDNKMVLNSDLSLLMKNFEKLNLQSFIFLSDDFNYVKDGYNYKNNIIGSFLIKKGASVLYSPYYIEFGDLFGKNKTGTIQPFTVQVTKSLKIIVDNKNSLITKDDIYVTVSDYVSKPVLKDDIAYVNNLNFVGKYLYSKVTVLDIICASRVRSIFRVNGDVVSVTGTAMSSDIVSQPIIQQITGNIEENVNNGGI